MLRLPVALRFSFALVLGTACSSGGTDETTAGESGDETAATATGTSDETTDTGGSKPWPQEQAELFCAQLFECDCSETPHPYLGEAACVAEVQGFYEILQGIADERDDMYVDLDCMGVLPALAQEHMCETGLPHLNECAIVHGDDPWGTACATVTPPSFFEQYSSCAATLICNQGFCLERQPVPVGADEPCYFTPGAAVFELECVDGYVCDFDAAGTCHTVPADGTPCISQQCSPSSWCDPSMGLGEGICVALATLGEACNSDGDCDTGACESDVCVAPPEPPVLLCSLPVPGE